jgi:hypothetical protein
MYHQQIHKIINQKIIKFYFLHLMSQCCGSGSGIRDWVLFDPWIRDPE